MKLTEEPPTTPPAKVQIVKSPRDNCRLLADSPGKTGDVFVCPDGRGWYDIGPATPIPPVPQG